MALFERIYGRFFNEKKEILFFSLNQLFLYLQRKIFNKEI